MYRLRYKRINQNISLALTLWFTLLTTNVLSAGSWLSPIAEGPSKDYAHCQCCCQDHGGCSAECTCGGEPAAKDETALRSCSGGALPDHGAFVWVTLKFIPSETITGESRPIESPLLVKSADQAASPDAQPPLKVPIAG